MIKSRKSVNTIKFLLVLGFSIFFLAHFTSQCSVFAIFRLQVQILKNFQGFPSGNLIRGFPSSNLKQEKFKGFSFSAAQGNFFIF